MRHASQDTPRVGVGRAACSLVRVELERHLRAVPRVIVVLVSDAAEDEKTTGV